MLEIDARSGRIVSSYRTRGRPQDLVAAGDSVHYQSSTPHRVSNPGNETAEVMFVISPPSY